MARRFSSSEIRSKIRQLEQKQRQAVNKYNQAVRDWQRKTRDAVNKYNSEVNRYNQALRAHNARVRANQNRLRSLVSQLNRQSSSSTRHVVYRTSVQTLHTVYTRFENRVESQQVGPEYNWFADLAERETANSIEVANQLDGIESATDETSDSLEASLGDRLCLISADLDDRWKGAVYSLSPQNPDAARHFCTSAREIFTTILEISAPDDVVFSMIPDADRTERGNATRRSKIKYLLHRKGMVEGTFEDFVEEDLNNVLELFQVFNEGTHGAAGRFGIGQLAAVKKRVEDGITFLTEIVN